MEAGRRVKRAEKVKVSGTFFYGRPMGKVKAWPPPSEVGTVYNKVSEEPATERLAGRNECS